MTKIFLFLLLCGIVIQACAQTTTTTTETPKPTTETPTTAAETPKPAAYTSDKEGWLVDLDEAYAVSQKDRKPIMANFTGSDWCGWCKRLDAAVFSRDEFKAWAKKNVVLLEVDFPRRKQLPQKNRQQNAAMQNALGITGYPTILVFNLDKDQASGQYHINGLGQTGYIPTVEEFIATVDKMVHP